MKTNYMSGRDKRQTFFFIVGEGLVLSMLSYEYEKQ